MTAIAVTQVADVGQLVRINKPQHALGANCPACRQRDLLAASEARLYSMIKDFNRNQDALAHCKHPQTKTVLMQRYVEDEWGVTLEQEDVEQCLGCARLLWERTI